MDTDYLTPMTYDCIRLADDAADVLRSELGAACSQYRNEDQYLQGILAKVKAIDNNPERYLDLWNLLEDADLKVFRKKIRVLREHIEKTLCTPIADRGAPDFKL